MKFLGTIFAVCSLFTAWNASADCGHLTVIQTLKSSTGREYMINFKKKDGNLFEIVTKDVEVFNTITQLRAAGFNTICVIDDKGTAIDGVID